MRPQDCEFPQEVRNEALRRSEYRCEKCGCPKEETYEGFLQFHHIVGVALAVRYHPELAHSAIASLANCRVLCCKCHNIMDAEDRKNHAENAKILRALLRKESVRIA